MTYPRPSDRKWRLKGDGRDEGAGLQRFLDDNAGKPVSIDRRYYTGQPLTVPAATVVHSPSRHLAGIHAHDALPLDAEMLRLQSGAQLHNVDLVGSPEHREGGAIAVVVQGADDVTLRGCGLSWFHHLVVPAATRRLRMHGCEFAYWSDTQWMPDPGSPEGQAIIAANEALPDGERLPANLLRLRGNCQDNGGYGVLGGNGSWPNDGVEIIGCDFHDGGWTAIDCLGPHKVDWQIIDTRITNVHEVGIYLGVRAIIDRVTIVGVKRRDCSAHCIEGGGIGSRVTNSTFGRADGSIFFFANPREFYFGHNVCFNACEEMPPGLVTPWASAMHARNMGPVPDELVSDGWLIEENDFHCTSGKLAHMLYMYDDGAGPFRNTTIRANRRHGHWTGEPLSADVSVRGPGFVYSP